MDAMIPFMGRITQVQIQPKGAFYIAGVKEAKVSAVNHKHDNKHTRQKQRTQANDAKDESNTAQDGHIDTWA